MSVSPNPRPLNASDHLAACDILRMEDIHEEPDTAPHGHDYFVLMWVKAGQGEHQIDMQTFPVKPGMLFFLRPQQVHHLEIDKPVGYVVRFQMDFLCATGLSDSWLDELGLFPQMETAVPLTVSGAFEARLEYLMNWLWDEQLDDQELAADVVSGVLKLILLACARVRLTLEEGEGQHEEGEKALAHNFRNLVEAHYHEWHKVSEYADKLFVTPNHLKDVVKEGLGVPAKAFIQERIMLEAKRKAHFTDLTTKEVAFSLGFRDPSHFGKFFKNCEGVSFSAFRAKAGK